MNAYMQDDKITCFYDILSELDVVKSGLTNIISHDFNVNVSTNPLLLIKDKKAIEVSVLKKKTGYSAVFTFKAYSYSISDEEWNVEKIKSVVEDLFS